MLHYINKISNIFVIFCSYCNVKYGKDCKINMQLRQKLWSVYSAIRVRHVFIALRSTEDAGYQWT
jgi:hypothetical protein